MSEAKRPTPLPIVLLEDRVALTGVLGALGIAVGSALPWAVVPTVIGSVTETGLEASGKVTLIAGILALLFVVAALRLPGRDLPVAAAVSALAAAGIGGAYLAQIRASSARVLARLLEGRGALDPGTLGTSFTARPGAGIWVVLAGSAAVLVASAALLLRSRTGRAAEGPA